MENVLLKSNLDVASFFTVILSYMASIRLNDYFQSLLNPFFKKKLCSIICGWMYTYGCECVYRHPFNS